MKWYSPIFTIPITLVMVLLVGWVFYENKNLNFRNPAPQAVTPIIPTRSASSVPTFFPSPHAATVATNTVSQLGEQWKTYRDEALKFQIRYPKNGWDITSRMGSTILSYTPTREPINIYTQRAVPTQGPISAPITIAFYKKPSAPLIEWLSEGFRVDLSKVKRGGIDTALARAYAFETGILTYNEVLKNGVIIYEVGEASSNYDALSYATFFVNEDLSYVYEISFHLPYYGTGWKADPSDSEYIEMYKRIVSTFQFTD